MRVIAVLFAAAVAVLGPACASTPKATPPTVRPTVAASTAARTTTTPTTSTTVFQPSAPASSGPAAAAELVAAWRSGNRAEAAAVATPAAAATLLAQPYPRAGVQFRSCGQQAPLTCTYRNLDTDGLYDLAVVQAATGGWYVQSVAVET